MMEDIYFITVALVVFIIAVAVSFSRTKLLVTGFRTKGIVLEKVIRNRSGPGSAGSKCVRVVYDDQNGECREFIDQNNFVSSLYKIDQELQLLIDRNNPNRVVVNGFFSLYLPSILLFAMSGSCVYMVISFS
jgi:hypothetical protein